MSNNKENLNVNDQNEEKIILSARINKEKFKVSLKLHTDLEEPLESAAEERGLTVQQYCEAAIREKLKADGKL